MKEQIFRLCKRLKNCTLNDLVQMLEVEQAIVETALLYLEQEDLISIKNGVISATDIKPKKDILTHLYHNMESSTHFNPKSLGSSLW